MDIAVVTTQMVILILMMAVGYFATIMRIYDEHANMNFAALALYVTVPAMILSSVEGAAEVGTKADAVFVFIITLILFACLGLLSRFVPRLFKSRPQEEGMLQFLTIFVNNGFMGFPVIQAIFGNGALFYASIMNIPNNILVFTLGIYLINKGGRRSPVTMRSILTNPANVASVLALIFFFFDLHLPGIVRSTAESIGNMTSPLAMMIIGASIVDINMKQALGKVPIYLFAFFRMLLLPLVIWLVARPFIDNSVILGVLVMISAMPGPAVAVTLSTQYGQDPSLATQYIFISTALSVLTIPLLAGILF